MCYFFIESSFICIRCSTRVVWLFLIVLFNVLFDVLSVYFLIYFSTGYIVASFWMFMLSLTCVSMRRLVGMSRPPCLFSGFVFSSCPCVLSSCLRSFVIRFTPLEVNNHPYCCSVFFFLF